ncbi:MAG: flagellar protein FliS [Roseburia sp.]
MKKEQMQDFTRRISRCNRSELVVILYEVLFAHLADAKEAYRDEDWGEFKEALRRSERTIRELMGALDFSYGLANELGSIYVFCKETLAKAMYKRNLDEIDLAEELMRKLYEAFVEVAKQDTSDPLMSNTQQVYAGYTYGREDVDTYQEFDASRGFFV